MTTFVSDWAATSTPLKDHDPICDGHDLITGTNRYQVDLSPKEVRDILAEAGCPPAWLERIEEVAL
jgi:hypothetical protein